MGILYNTSQSRIVDIYAKITTIIFILVASEIAEHFVFGRHWLSTYMHRLIITVTL